MTVLVLCLEGCHGSGKSAIMEHFTNVGIETIDEGFMDMPNKLLHPQSLIMETKWVCAWFERLIDLVSKMPSKGEKNKVIVTDRSPFSAVFYTKSNGHLLEPVIRSCIDEVSAFDVHVMSVHIRTERSLLWQRIQDRLVREPHRVAFNEASMEWMDLNLNRYDGFSWSATVSNNHKRISDVSFDILNAIEGLDNDGAWKAPFDELKKLLGVDSFECSSPVSTPTDVDPPLLCRGPEGSSPVSQKNLEKPTFVDSLTSTVLTLDLSA